MAGLDPEMFSLVSVADMIDGLPPPFTSALSADFLKDIWIVPPTVRRGDDGSIFYDTGLFLDRPISLHIPGLDAVQLVVGAVGDLTIFEFAIQVLPDLKVTLKDVVVALRLQGDLFKPARLNQDTNAYEVDPTRDFVDIQLGTLSLSVDGDAGLQLETNATIKLPSTMIGNSGVVIQASNIQLFLTGSGLQGKKGVSIPSAQVFLPGTLGRSTTLTMNNAFIGNGGFSGTVGATISPPIDEDFGGLAVALDAVSIKFVQNALIDATLTGSMLVPYFDKRVQAALTLGLDGHIALAVTGVAPGDGQFDPTTGLITLAAGPLTFTLTRLGVELVGGKGIFHAAGKIKPEYQGLTFPSFDVQDLSIDTDGHVKVSGGWIDLPNQVSLSLFGFTLEITKIGFGSLDDGRNWVGFSGGLKLVDGLSAGASVDGLRIMWHSGPTPSPTISLDGVGIKLDIPNTLLLEGEVSLKGEDFRGAVKLALPSLNFQFDGQFVAGNVPGTTNQKYFAIFVHTELPAGIPLGSTGLALYGGAGLFAHNMIPGKLPTEGWYANPDGTPGWYLRGKAGVDDLTKWSASGGGLGFGAGVTIGTFPDNGFNFSGRLLLVVAFPGPIVIIEGKANLFRKRSELGTGEPMFRALAILDAGKSFLMNLDARFKYKADGRLLDMAGSAEAFFDFKKGDNWHIWLGVKDDKKRRIRARAFQLFTVDAYFQLNARQLDVGSGWSFDKRYGFSHLEVRVAASFEEGGSFSWHPAHFAGFLSMQGRAELRAFGRGVGLNVKATVNGEVFEPMALKGDFRVGIDLPWPLPDVGGTVTLEWKRQMSTPPRLPLPLQEASAEIPSRALRWPFTRGVNLVPKNDAGPGDAELASPPGTGTGAPLPTSFDFSKALRVPVDAKLGLSFGRPVHDPALVGQYQTPVVPADVVGDPVSQDITKGDQNVKTGYTVAYTLSSVTLEKLAPIAPSEPQSGPLPPLPASAGRVGWVTVAQKGGTGPTGPDELFGAWTPALPPQMPLNQQNASGTTHAQTKLLLNAKSPFDYTALSSRAWDEWVSQDSPGYPCSPANPNEKFVAVFDQPAGTQLPQAPGHFQFTNPAFDVQWFYGGDIASNEEVVDGVLGPIDRGLRMLPLPRPSGIVGTEPERIVPPPGVNEVDIRIGTPATLTPFFQRGVFVPGVDPQLVLDRTLLVSTFKVVEGQRDPNVAPPVAIQSGNGHGLSIPFSVSLRPREPAIAVELGFFADTENPDVVGNIELFDSSGAPLLSSPRPINTGRTTVRLEAADIAEIVLTSEPGTFPLLETIYVRTPIMAIASSSSGIVGTFHEENGLLKVVGPNLGPIILGATCGGQFLVLELAIPSRRDEVIRHTVESLARFKDPGPVFEPDTNYRLTVRTQRDSTPKGSNAGPVAAKTAIAEQVYFQTAALPGIGVPDLPAGTKTENLSVPALSGFEDLTFYVKRTVPEVPAPAGGHQTPARAVYRAYDQNVEFSTDTPYVELMYLLGRRDLSLRLYDANSLPLRDAQGRVIVPSSLWEQSHDETLSGSTNRWIATVNAAACAGGPSFNARDARRSEVASAPSEAVVLPPEVLHQARVVPMLLHEGFVKARTALVANGQGAQLDRWRAETGGATASWKARSQTLVPPGQTASVTVYFVSEESGVASTLVYDGPLVSLDDTAHHDHPRNWTDVSARVQLRWQTGEVGFEVRRASANDLIRVVLNRDTGARQLIAVSGGTSSVLAQDTTTFPSTASDVVVTVECEDDHVLVFQQLAGEPKSDPIFDVTGAPRVAGPVALVSNGATGTRFTEIVVHDLRANPSTAFEFDFITSKFTNFHHHLHSFNDQMLAAPAGAGVSNADISANGGAGIDLSATATAPGFAAVGVAEERAFNALEEAALHSDKLRAPEQIEVLKANLPGAQAVFLVRSPEPLRWERTQLVASTATQPLDLGVPGDLKIASIELGSTPAAESVTILVRAPSSLSNARIDWRPLGDPNAAWTVYHEFDSEPPSADGLAVQVFSGDATQAPARRPGTEQRFVTADPASATVHFPAAGVEIRLRGASDSVIHQRQFLPPPSFSGLDMRAVRKSDGTALFLFPAAGASLPPLPATLRLAFRFARDLQEAPPALQPVLSQAGDSDPEVVLLDVKIQ